jgi:hypothetical protein
VFLKGISLTFIEKARVLRENAIGGDNVESSNVYNNLGCCMQRLGRSVEASTYYELSYAIFDLELG